MNFELFAVIALCVVLAAVLKDYERIRREIKSIRGEKEEIEQRARQSAGKILDDAKDKALRIIEDARIDAEKVRQEVSGKLDLVSDKLLHQYKEILQNISNVVMNEAVRELKDFDNTLKMETIHSQKIIAQKIQEQFLQITDELEKYRLRKLSEINERIFSVVRTVSMSVIGKSLSIDDHTELIIRALEEAKHDNII